MTAFPNPIKALVGVLLLCITSACTSATVEQDLAPQPIAQTQPVTPTSETGTTALAPETTPTPGQTVTEAQIESQTPTTTQEVASLDTSKAITFLPFEGAPQSKTASLNRLLNSSAQEQGLAILPTTRTGAKYRVKGYFSALNDGNGTMLVYVWDVVDGTGKRLHRINGRERTGTSRTDPWQAISDQEMARVAKDTTARLKTWIDARS